MHLLRLFTALFQTITFVSALRMSFDPMTVDKLEEDHNHTIYLNASSGMSHLLYLRIDNPNLAELVEPANGTLRLEKTTEYLFGEETEEAFKNYSITVRGIFLGRTTLKFYMAADGSSNATAPNGSVVADDGVVPLGGSWWELATEYRIAVIRNNHVVDGIFTLTVILIVFLASISIGCKMDLEVVKSVLKKPIAPAIGLFCQFVIMPLIGYAVAKALQMRGPLGLGVFAMGCAPGGGASNMYTILLDGDLDLSVTMTLLSTVLSLAFIPLWLFTLGQHEFTNDDEFSIQIPFQNAMYSLASIVIAVGIGLLIKYKRPTWAHKITYCIRPTFLILLLVIFTFGVWANLYIFTIFREQPINLVAGCLLPWCGFILGGLIAFACRQDFKRIKTIAIETGIQNSGIPIILMKLSLPQPDADISIAPPVAASCFTPIPLLIAVVIHLLHRRYKGKQKLEEVVKDAEFDDLHVGSGDAPESDMLDKEGNIIEKKPIENGFSAI